MGQVQRIARCVGLLVPALVLASCASSGSSGAHETKYPARVALFGDSLSFEAQPYYTDLIEATGETALTYDSYGGTAICDWFDKMREVASEHHPTAVELQFSGNALTPCMKGYEPGTPAYYDKYRSDVLTAIDIFVPSGAHVYLVGAPITRSQQSQPDWDALNEEYAAIAAGDARHVSYVDAGAAVEGPNHTYAETLPCLAVEPCLGPVEDGVPSNVVRSPDGAHFCPVEQGDQAGVIGACSVYSSGAYRYANAMVQALADPISSGS